MRHKIEVSIRKSEFMVSIEFNDIIVVNKYDI